MIKVINDRILVKHIEKENISSGGIILVTENKNDQYITGKIIELGVGKYFNNKFVPFLVNKDDYILFAKHQGEFLEYDNEKYQIIKEHDILAIIKDDELFPVGDVLLCERRDLSQLKSGLYISAKGIKQDIAKIIKMGPGLLTSGGIYDNYDLKEGMFVLFDSHRGLTINWKQKEYFVLGLGTILAASESDDVIKLNDIF